MKGASGSRADVLALRVAELSAVLKSRSSEIEELRGLLNHNRAISRDHEQIIRTQEAQLLERDAQLQAQNAEIRALRRQHTHDAEALRAAEARLKGRLRPSGSMGTPRAAQSGAQKPVASLPPSPANGNGNGAVDAPRSKPSPNATRKQLQQAIADKVRQPRQSRCSAFGRRRLRRPSAARFGKRADRPAAGCHRVQVVLVRALHQLTAEMAQARAESRQYAAVSERSLSTAWRLGQLGQLGLALLDSGDANAQPTTAAAEDSADIEPCFDLLDAAVDSSPDRTL